MNLLLYKLSVAPLLVIGATLAGRRWGQTVAGLVAGFPIVAGPILFFYAVEQGPAYAASAAQATLLGLFSLCLFAMAYSWRAWMGGTVLSCLMLSWVAFAFGTSMVSRIHTGLAQSFLIALASLFLASRSLPPTEPMGSAGPPSAWDLPLRGLAAALLVFSLTHFADFLGPRFSGFLTPFPVASTVLAAFAQAQGGGAAVKAVLKGLLLALNAFAVFCAVLVLTLPAQGIAFSFGLALLAATAVQAALFWMTQKR